MNHSGSDSNQHESIKPSSGVLLPGMKSKSSILHKPKAEVFPTINVIPKKLHEVEQYYRQIALSSRATERNKVSEEQLLRIKKAFHDKILEKKKAARQMRTEESKIRWAIEREVKYRQQMEEQERMKQELSYNQRERYLQQQVEKKRREQQKEFFSRAKTSGRGTSHSRRKQHTDHLVKQPQTEDQRKPSNPAPFATLPKKKSTSSRLAKERGEKFTEQIEQLKGKLRVECVKVIEREDALNTVLLSLRSYT